MEKEHRLSLIRLSISLVLFLLAIFLPISFPYGTFAIFLTAYLVVGLPVIKEAILSLWHREVLEESFLMWIATIGAFIIQEYPEAVMVMWLYQLGEFFQDYASNQSRKSIRTLMELKPEYANIEKDGELVSVLPEEVEIGTIITIKPGEKIPLDGVVVAGTSQLDVSHLTGESAWQKVAEGDNCFSGSINQSGVIQLRVTQKYENSTVSKILTLIEHSASQKTKTENFITKFAKYYTPLVVGSAVLVAIIPPLFLHADWLTYLYRACSFLVISCPCALVISVPLSFFSGLGCASRHGILIKGSDDMETLAHVKTIVFDKTGTLTKGNFEVTQIHAENVSPEELLRLCAHVENFSEHPIALSIKRAYGKALVSSSVTDVKEIEGKGIQAIVEGKCITVGNAKCMQEISITPPTVQEVGTIVYVAIENEYQGYFVIADQIKEEAKDAISLLHRDNIHHIMLTGDHSSVAQKVAKELSIQEVHAELLPADKVEALEKVLDKHEQGKVAFVGDGINDAPVLMRADVGIAMGGLGSDSAIECADVVIMDDNLLKIGKGIQISQKTLRIVKENITFSLLVKGAILLLSVFGISNLWQAVFADVGVSMIAILNAMRAYR